MVGWSLSILSAGFEVGGTSAAFSDGPGALFLISSPVLVQAGTGFPRWAEPFRIDSCRRFGPRFRDRRGVHSSARCAGALLMGVFPYGGSRFP